MKASFLFLTLCLSTTIFSQDLSVPDEILDELETVVIETAEDTFAFRVHYPKNYRKEKSYKLFLGLSGGEQNFEIVDYCYAAWFRSGYFMDYITVLPVVNSDTINFKDYDDDRINHMIETIDNHFNLNEKWLIAGTSNGGIAAYNFVAANPKKFEGLIVAPGEIKDVVPGQDWSHLNVIIAFGELDLKAWIDISKDNAKQLKKIVNSVELVKMTDQGHILPISFNVDKIYDAYFLRD